MNSQIQKSGAQGPGNYEAAKEWHRIEQEKFDKTGGIAHDQLTVRDKFAGWALAALIPRVGQESSLHDFDAEVVAKTAYRCADAMIEARKNGG